MLRYLRGMTAAPAARLTTTMEIDRRLRARCPLAKSGDYHRESASQDIRRRWSPTTARKGRKACRAGAERGTLTPLLRARAY